MNTRISILVVFCCLPIYSMDPKQSAQSLLQAARDGNISIVQQELEKGCSVNEVDQDGQTPLHVACIKGHTATAEMLLANKAQIEAKTNNDETPLHLACYYGHTATAGMLLANKAQIEAKNNNRFTPLHMACYNGYTETAQMLLDQGAQIEAKTNKGNTPLHLACYRGHTATAGMLLANKAQIEAKNNTGNTPLHWTCGKGHTATAGMLLAKGASIATCNNQNNTPLQLAIQIVSDPAHTEPRPDLKVIKLLVMHSSRIDRSSIATIPNGEIKDFLTKTTDDVVANSINLYEAAVSNFESENVKRWVHLGADVSVARQPLLNTPLHFAAKYGNVAMAKFLLTHGAEIDAQNIQGNTPLHIAALHEHTPMIHTLLCAKANPTILNNNQENAVHIVSGKPYPLSLFFIAASDSTKQDPDFIRDRRNYIAEMHKEKEQKSEAQLFASPATKRQCQSKEDTEETVSTEKK